MLGNLIHHLALSSFYSYAQKNRYITSSTHDITINGLWFTTLGGKYPWSVCLRLNSCHARHTQKDVFIFTIDQINQLLNTNDIRMYTFILLGFDCGLRVSEVVKLRISDIDSKNMLLHIRNSKRNKSRVVTLSNTCLHALRKYYLTYDRPDDYLFPGIKRPHMHPSTLNNMFTQYLKQFDFYTKDIHYHSLRHTFATMTLETGENIFLLKKLLGHSSLSSTSRYIKYDRHDIQKVIPLSQKLGVF